ncbi:MAG: single-stranded DNA-binding protein [Chitinispirillales bacterium]|jgi:single-strand DNA-binding protein|nr:single-stranded DNA-binding protein [Chitinispirillales bacterium]
MASLNKVIIVGNLGRDPELRSTASGSKVLEVSIATTERFKDKDGNDQEQTDWHRIVMWNQKAEYVVRNTRKGSCLYVEGKLRYRKYTDKDGNDRTTTEILADNVAILGGRTSSDSNNFVGEQPQYQKPYENMKLNNFEENLSEANDFTESSPAIDDNLPF